MWPLINNQEITRDVLYLSKKEAIKDLKEKLFRIYNLNFKIEDKYKNPGNSRIWKVDARCSIEQLIVSFKLFTDTSRNSKKTLIFKAINIYFFFKTMINDFVLFVFNEMF